MILFQSNLTFRGKVFKVTLVTGNNFEDEFVIDNKEPLAQGFAVGTMMFDVGDEVVYNGSEDALVTIVGDRDMRGCARNKIEERRELWVAPSCLELKVAAADG